MTVSKSRFTPSRSLPNRSLFLKRAQRRGLTLIEIMIALTMTLIVLGAMMSAFRYASEKMQLGRSVMEMANQLRSAEELLRNDLANLTLEPRPYTEAAAPNGFLEINEGPDTDGDDFGAIIAGASSYLGDVDDSIGMTVRSADGRRFRGVRIDGAGAPMVIESTVAEVWYFTTLNDLASDPSVVATDVATIDIEDSIRLHRRALLIRPDLGVLATDLRLNVEDPTVDDVDSFVANNDISVRVVAQENGLYSIVANTLADLALRRNRFAHLAPTFTVSNFPNSPAADITIRRLKPNGEDILLTDVAGFDVRVYSPNAEVRRVDGLLLEPGDSGYVLAPPGTEEVGAFVDLGYKGTVTDTEWFASLSTTKSQLSTNYDTWSPSYESDGIDQDGVAGVDQGTNGLDDFVDVDNAAGTGTPDGNDDGTSAPDDDAERETRPPYPFPIRGIQISTRLIEKTTQQVQQSSVIQSYVPE